MLIFLGFFGFLTDFYVKFVSDIFQKRKIFLNERIGGEKRKFSGNSHHSSKNQKKSGELSNLSENKVKLSVETISDTKFIA